MNTSSLLNGKLLITASAMAMAMILNVGQANATLIGDTVGCNVTGAGPFDFGPFICDTATAVVGAGAEFQVVNNEDEGFSVDIGDSTIVLTSNELLLFKDTIINLTDLDWVGFPNGIITAVELAVTGGVFNLGAGDITFGDHSISIDLNGSEFDRNDMATITLITAGHSTIPEPASLVLFGFGLLGLGAMRRRRRTA